MKWSLIVVASLAVVGCKSKKNEAGPSPKPSPENGSGSAGGSAGSGSAATEKHGLALDNIKREVKPGDDFFTYANGAWIEKTEIPADRSSWGNNAIVAEQTTARTADLIKEAAASAPAGSDAKRVGDYYASFMAEDEIEAKGLAPLQPKLDAIAAITDAKGLATWMGGELRADVDAFNATDFETSHILGLWVAQDLDDPSHYSPFLLQGGLGMPDRDFYLEDNPRMAEIRTKYEAHIATILTLAKISDAPAKAKAIFALETSIAKAHGTRTDSADV